MLIQPSNIIIEIWKTANKFLGSLNGFFYCYFMILYDKHTSMHATWIASLDLHIDWLWSLGPMFPAPPQIKVLCWSPGFVSGSLISKLMKQSGIKSRPFYRLTWILFIHLEFIWDLQKNSISSFFLFCCHVSLSLYLVAITCSVIFIDCESFSCDSCIFSWL